MTDSLTERVKNEYEGRAFSFFARIEAANLPEVALAAVPSLFLPGWGEEYDCSSFKVAIAGKETLDWGNEHGDSLLCDLNAYKTGAYDVLASCSRFRRDGPAEWQNVFWQYPASVLARLFDCRKDEVLRKNCPVLRGIAWFNGHAIETYESNGVSKVAITPSQVNLIQQTADQCGLSDFCLFAKVFQPHVILYFYRNKSGVPDRGFPEDIEFVRYWGDGNLAKEWRMEGRTILLQLPHTTFLRHKRIPESLVADIVAEVLNTRGVRLALCDRDSSCDFYRMSAVEWARWVDFVRNEARKLAEMDNMTLSRHLMVSVATELRKRNARMTAQTLVLLLNEVDKFRHDNWLYSKERRGPCSSIRGAWNAYSNAGKQIEADWLAEAFTKLDGTHAWK